MSAAAAVSAAAASPAPNMLLRAWRLAAGLTQAQMAEAVNCTPTGVQAELTCDVKRVAKWESGQTRWPRPAYRRALYDLTGQDPQSLGFTPQAAHETGPVLPPASRRDWPSAPSRAGGASPQARPALPPAREPAHVAYTPPSMPRLGNFPRTPVFAAVCATQRLARPGMAGSSPVMTADHTWHSAGRSDARLRASSAALAASAC